MSRGGGNRLRLPRRTGFHSRWQAFRNPSGKAVHIALYATFRLDQYARSAVYSSAGVGQQPESLLGLGCAGTFKGAREVLVRLTQVVTSLPERTPSIADLAECRAYPRDDVTERKHMHPFLDRLAATVGANTDNHVTVRESAAPWTCGVSLRACGLHSAFLQSCLPSALPVTKGLSLQRIRQRGSSPYKVSSRRALLALSVPLIVSAG